jgi:N-methylhydantoinase A/acetophenone carboxylase
MTADTRISEQEAFEQARTTIDVDVGGTFTDMVMVVDGRTVFHKVPTTPYDLSVCFMQVIEEGAEELGLTVGELAPRIDAVRYSTTVAMNRLIERDGPRLGLITTEGHEDALQIGKGAQWIDGKRLDERRALRPGEAGPSCRAHDRRRQERIDGRGRSSAPHPTTAGVRLLVDRGAPARRLAALVVRQPRA